MSSIRVLPTREKVEKPSAGTMRRAMPQVSFWRLWGACVFTIPKQKTVLLDQHSSFGMSKVQVMVNCVCLLEVPTRTGVSAALNPAGSTSWTKGPASFRKTPDNWARLSFTIDSTWVFDDLSQNIFFGGCIGFHTNLTLKRRPRPRRSPVLSWPDSTRARKDVPK